MSVILLSSGGGSITLQEPVTASNLTQTLADVEGTLAPIVRGNAVASTSGTAIDFTGIPAWAKRITVMFNGVSTSGTSNLLVQLGTSGGIDALTYAASSVRLTATTASATYTTGLGINSATAAAVTGLITIANVTGNTWVSAFVLAETGSNGFTGGGTKTLAAVLDRVRITTLNGTDTFDAGTINVMWE